MYFLDTNICVYFLKGIYEEVRYKIQNTSPKEIKIPSIVKAELLYGAEKSTRRKQNIEKINYFLDPFEIICFDDKSSIEYAFLRADLEKKGSVIGPNDFIIASIVKSNNGTLVTNNVKEFKRIKNLRIENWVNQA
ncbi:MAG: type II toxin-antitoxin system VapC family toxin [Spirochaetes bacterium]|nr:type II toxin-antitoxin system VapC family toxin [Spirochaetota bacterium]